MSEKKQQREEDRELIRTEMRGIIQDSEAHERDRVAAAKLLRQVNLDEDVESPNHMTDRLESDQIALLKSCGLTPPGCDETDD